MAKPHKFWVFRVTVKGRGYFPIDMLRYDRCSPASEVESYKIIASFGDVLETREIVLVSHYSTNRGGATAGRWASFGWTVVKVEPVE